MVVVEAAVAAAVAVVAGRSDMPRNMDSGPACQARHHRSSRWVRHTPVLYSRVKHRTTKFYRKKKETGQLAQLFNVALEGLGGIKALVSSPGGAGWLLRHVSAARRPHAGYWRHLRLHVRWYGGGHCGAI